MSNDTIQHKGRPAEILLIEDNRGDILLMQKAFKQIAMPNNVNVARSGEEALQILRREGTHTGASQPDLIMLDLNLPKKSGKDVLQEIKSDDTLRHIPVIVLTSSRADLDVLRIYNLHANSYIVKPNNFEKFGEIVASIEKYWFATVILPDEKYVGKD